MRDRQISLHRVAYELTTLTTTVYEIMSNHLDMRKLSTRSVPKLLTPRDNYFDLIVTGDKTLRYTITILSVKKKSSSGRNTNSTSSTKAGKGHFASHFHYDLL